MERRVVILGTENERRETWPNIYIGRCVHILPLHNQRVDHGHVTLGGGRVDAARPALVGHQQRNAFLEQNLKRKGVNHIPVMMDVTMAVSGCSFKAAMCIRVDPSLDRSKTEALNLSIRNSTIMVWPLSAAM